MSPRTARAIARAASLAGGPSSSSSVVGGAPRLGAVRRLSAISSSSACTDPSSHPSSSSPIMSALPGRARGYHSIAFNNNLDRPWGSPRLFFAGGDGETSSVTSNTSILRRAISSTPLLLDDSEAAKPAAEEEAKPPSDYEKSVAAAEASSGEEVPEYQNPLHHHNPDYDGTKVLEEDFAPGEEMPAVPLPPFETSEDGGVIASPELHALADEIVHMSMLEVKELVDRVGDHFGFEDDDGAGFGGEDGGDGGGGEEAAVVEEKTVFDLKLTAFDAKTKIKVIKEVRAITSLGLKEAKELVEGAPTTVKKDIKKEEAEELKEKLEKVGATIEIV